MGPREPTSISPVLPDHPPSVLEHWSLSVLSWTLAKASEHAQLYSVSLYLQSILQNFWEQSFEKINEYFSPPLKSYNGLPCVAFGPNCPEPVNMTQPASLTAHFLSTSFPRLLHTRQYCHTEPVTVSKMHRIVLTSRLWASPPSYVHAFLLLPDWLMVYSSDLSLDGITKWVFILAHKIRYLLSSYCLFSSVLASTLKKGPLTFYSL